MSIPIRNNINLTEFIKGKKVKIISDFEGKISSNLYQQEIFLITNNKRDLERFIYCGDIADYTGQLNISDPERYKFLKFIKFINDNHTKFAYVLGNRDTNKLKLLQLILFKEQTNKWWRGSSTDPLTNINILDISDTLLSQDKPDWLVEDLTSFYPYWNSSSTVLKEWKGWKSTKTKLSLYERFLAIFGVDPKDGTMSAQNTIVCIALELGLLREEVNIYVNQLNKTQQDQYFFNAANKLAALVFTVYARILDPELSDAKKKWDYDGSLYEYLINGNIVSYAFDKTNESNSTKLYLFSHGGVHSNFNKDLIKTIPLRENYWKAVDEKMTEMILSQKGGQIDMINNLDLFNNTIKEAMKECFKEFTTGYTDNNTISNNLKFTMTIGTGCGSFYNDDLKKQGSNHKSIEKCDNLNTPVLPGYDLIMEDSTNLFTQPKPLEIFNIFGHSPTGFGYTFSISKNNSKIICTDFSNSFSNSNFTDFNQNTFILVLQNDTFSLEGKIYFDLKSKEEVSGITKKLEKDDEDFYIIKGTNGVLDFQKLLLKKKEIFITFDVANQIDFNTQNTILKKFNLSVKSNQPSLRSNFDSNANFNYHGTGKLDNFTVHIFSFIKKNFKKNLILIVSKNSPVLVGGKKKSKIYKKQLNKSSNKSKKNNLRQNKKKSKYKF